jgi:hypothetical protein
MSRRYRPKTNPKMRSKAVCCYSTRRPKTHHSPSHSSSFQPHSRLTPKSLLPLSRSACFRPCRNPSGKSPNP